MSEKWKPIKDCPDYRVSNRGRVMNKRGRILSQARIGNGMSVMLRHDGCNIGKRVARLVGAAFSSAYSEYLYAVYRDGDPRNCACGNLKWVPRREVTGVPFSKNERTEP